MATVAISPSTLDRAEELLAALERAGYRGRLASPSESTGGAGRSTLLPSVPRRRRKRSQETNHASAPCPRRRRLRRPLDGRCRTGLRHLQRSLVGGRIAFDGCVQLARDHRVGRHGGWHLRRSRAVRWLAKRERIGPASSVLTWMGVSHGSQGRLPRSTGGAGARGPGRQRFGWEMLGNFLHVFERHEDRPHAVCFYTEGVKAVCEGSPVLLGLRLLQGWGSVSSPARPASTTSACWRRWQSARSAQCTRSPSCFKAPIPWSRYRQSSSRRADPGEITRMRAFEVLLLTLLACVASSCASHKPAVRGASTPGDRQALVLRVEGMTKLQGLT